MEPYVPIKNRVTLLINRIEAYHHVKMKVLKSGYKSALEKESFNDQMKELSNEINKAEKEIETLEAAQE